MNQDPLRTLFERLDTNGSGFIEASDYRRVLHAWVTDQDIRDRILKMDLDLDARISFAEFAQHLTHSAGAVVESPLRGFKRRDGTIDWFKVFVQFDTDGSGILSLVELKAFVEALDGDTAREELVELIRAMDQNGDLQVSYAEFQRYFSEPSKPRRIHQSV